MQLCLWINNAARHSVNSVVDRGRGRPGSLERDTRFGVQAKPQAGINTKRLGRTHKTTR